MEKTEVQVEELLKSIDAFLNKTDAEVLEKAKKKDEEEEAEKACKKKEEEEASKAKKAAEDKEEEEASKAKKKEEKKEEKEDKDEAKKGAAEGGEDNIGHKKDLPSSAATKSFSNDEYEEYMDLKKAKENEKFDNLSKSISGVTEMVSALAKQVETLSKSPVSAPKSADGFKPVEKGAESANSGDESLVKSFREMNPAIRKSKVSNLMLEEGVKKGTLDASDVAEYEFSGTLRNPERRRVVEMIVKKALKDGTLI